MVCGGCSSGRLWQTCKPTPTRSSPRKREREETITLLQSNTINYVLQTPEGPAKDMNHAEPGALSVGKVMEIGRGTHSRISYDTEITRHHSALHTLQTPIGSKCIFLHVRSGSMLYKTLYRNWWDGVKGWVGKGCTYGGIRTCDYLFSYFHTHWLRYLWNTTEHLTRANEIARWETAAWKTISNFPTASLLHFFLFSLRYTPARWNLRQQHCV